MKIETRLKPQHENQNTITVDAPTFLVNRKNPTQISYGEKVGRSWKCLTLQTYALGLPDPGSSEILYKLRGSNSRGSIINVNNF